MIRRKLSPVVYTRENKKILLCTSTFGSFSCFVFWKVSLLLASVILVDLTFNLWAPELLLWLHWHAEGRRCVLSQQEGKGPLCFLWGEVVLLPAAPSAAVHHTVMWQQTRGSLFVFPTHIHTGSPSLCLSWVPLHEHRYFQNPQLKRCLTCF